MCGVVCFLHKLNRLHRLQKLVILSVTDLHRSDDLHCQVKEELDIDWSDENQSTALDSTGEFFLF